MLLLEEYIKQYYLTNMNNQKRRTFYMNRIILAMITKSLYLMQK